MQQPAARLDARDKCNEEFLPKLQLLSAQRLFQQRRGGEYQDDRDPDGIGNEFGLAIYRLSSEHTSAFTVKGGTFVGYNPADNYFSTNMDAGWKVYDEEGGAGWVPASHKCESIGENTWKVSKK